MIRLSVNLKRETKYPGEIDKERLTRKMKLNNTFFLFEMTPEEVKKMPIINFNINNVKNQFMKEEVIQSRWINLSELEHFVRKHKTNKTLSEFKIGYFLKLTGIDHPLVEKYLGKKNTNKNNARNNNTKKNNTRNNNNTKKNK